jgi:hypothetical protein
VVGAAVWKMYGPFWENNVTIPPMDYWASYYTHIQGKDENDTEDMVRVYHLNAIADINKAFMKEPSLKVKEVQIPWS